MNFKIRHSVIFKLNHPKGSPEAKAFFEEARKLAAIEGVNRFESLLEVSPKNNFDYGLSMEFDSPQAYEAYQNDPSHSSFVQDFWIPNVKEFLEIDFELMG